MMSWQALNWQARLSAAGQNVQPTAESSTRFQGPDCNLPALFPPAKRLLRRLNHVLPSVFSFTAHKSAVLTRRGLST